LSHDSPSRFTPFKQYSKMPILTITAAFLCASLSFAAGWKCGSRATIDLIKKL
jgi:hypothetical protein